ncbi:MAG: cupredoxin domain-containing protein [Chloroflexota bacterium]|nr:cupredoxin domain-containing protein [Chloroflexota bacterium]
MRVLRRHARASRAVLGIRCSVALAAVLAVACAPAVAAPSTPPAAPPSATATVPPATIAASATSSARPTPTSARVTVEMAEDFFTPKTITVAAGTTVVWENVGEEDHDVQAKDGSFGSNRLGPGDSFSHTFTKPGTYPYFCTPHVGDGMVGEVDVR